MSIHSPGGLPAELAGRTLFPEDEGFQEEHSGWNLSVAHAPSAVVLAESAADVAAAVRYASGAGAPVAVLAAGHGASVPADGAVVVNTRRMKELSVDATARTARIGAGLVWGDVVAQTAKAGLAPLNGSSPTVGVMGYLTGGGLPVLGRTYGFATHRVRSFDLVTADGDVRTVTPDSEPDLFWAVRGGRGNFGVVTAAEIDLVPVTRVYGGGLFFPGSRAAEVLPAYFDWLSGQPEEMTSSVILLRFPDLPAVPEHNRGKFLIHVRIAFTGTPEEGERLVAPLRALGPERDVVEDMAYTRVGEIYLDPPRPTPAWARTALLRDVDAAAVQALLDVAGHDHGHLPPGGVEIRHLGGALSRPGAVPSALGVPEAGFHLFMSMPAQPGTEAAERARKAEQRVIDSLARWDTGRLLPTFMFSSDSAVEDVARGYAPEDYARLRRIKAAHDPGNMFRINHNIPPADHS
ncbi:FAD-binding oxidoreductase [Streptomyces sp. enrichment culture]|uniref:FAD-binding oxidoreductase n=1 Tax=Streptomyces sp. enrichment culture TaxID=1795815 RepID=UPI003F547E48